MTEKYDKAAVAEARKAERLKAQRKDDLKKKGYAAVAMLIIFLFVGTAFIGLFSA